MMDQIDAANLLKAKREDRNPKCANCRHWSSTGALGVAVGICQRNSYSTLAPTIDPTSPGAALRTSVHTTDLSVCSAWEKQDAAI